MADRADARWRGRPLLSAALRFFVFIVPIATSWGVSVQVVRSLPRAPGLDAFALRWGAAIIVSTIVLLVVDRLARRLMPLAVLLQLSMAFPHEAPSRLAVARRSSSAKDLNELAARARAGQLDEPARAAEHILSLVAAVEAHDRGTRGHSERVRMYTDMLGEELKLRSRDRDRLRWAALLHDVGKLMVAPEILNKPSSLAKKEQSIVRRHPLEGMRLAAPIREWLGEWAVAIEHHHERYDGTGYPHGLRGEQISLGGRIVNVADSYEVMTARRPYRVPMRANQARAELVKCSGTQFDPVLVRAFLRVSVGRLRLVSGPLAWLAQAPFLPAVQQAATAAGAAAAGGAAIVLGIGPAVPASAAQKPPQVSAPVIAPSDTPSLAALIAVIASAPVRIPSPSPAAMPEPGKTEPSPVAAPDPAPTPTRTPSPPPPPPSPKPSPPPVVADPLPTPPPPPPPPETGPTPSPSPSNEPLLPLPLPAGLGDGFF